MLGFLKNLAWRHKTAINRSIFLIVVLSFGWLTYNERFTLAPTKGIPAEFKGIETGKITPIDLEHQLRIHTAGGAAAPQPAKASSPVNITALLVFPELKAAAAVCSGFEQDKFAAPVEDLEKLMQLAEHAGIKVRVVPAESVPGELPYYWYLVAIGLFGWMICLLLLPKQNSLVRQLLEASLHAHQRVNAWRGINSHGKEVLFYGMIWLTIVVAAGSLCWFTMPAHRVKESVPSDLEHGHLRISPFQAERLVAEYPNSIVSATVVKGLDDTVALVIDAQQLERTPASNTVPATRRNASSEEGKRIKRLVRYKERNGNAYSSYVSALRQAGVPVASVDSSKLYVPVMVMVGLGLAILVHYGSMGLLFVRAPSDPHDPNFDPEIEHRLATATGGSPGGSRAEETVTKSTIERASVKKLDDVAGCDEAVAKFRLVAEWLRDARAYQHFGARLPKGVLLYGPPGTGKTLLAQALAGEVQGNFFQASASEFIEMYVGVGASRVRQLFGKARDAYKRSGKPSIVFIDEIDAVGKRRSSTGLSGDGERDQTVNQLLTCIQGFDSNNGTLVVAATNRAETLDPGLTRSGRFDFKIEVAKPDRRGRKAIFAVHARNVEVESGVEREQLYDELARRAYDFTGADIELAVNVARTRAAKRSAPLFLGKTEDEIKTLPKTVTVEDFHAGIDQVQYGELIKSRIRTDAERRATAVHEIGHAAIPTLLQGDPVSRITIVMTSKSLGLMENPTEEDRYGWSKKQFLLRIKTMLAGRIAEEEIENEASTGASNDFERASLLARQMVGVFGMSNLGPISIPLDENGLPAGKLDPILESEFGTAWRTIIRDCERETRDLIKQNRERIKYVASILLEEETFTGERFHTLWNEFDSANSGNQTAAETLTTTGGS